MPYPDLDALGALLLRVKGGEATFKSSTECEQFARARYSKGSMVKAYESIYRQLIERDLGRK